MSFTMLRSTESLFRGPIERALAIERLRELAASARVAAQAAPDLAGLDATLDGLARRLQDRAS